MLHLIFLYLITTGYSVVTIIEALQLILEGLITVYWRYLYSATRLNLIAELHGNTSAAPILRMRMYRTL